MDNYEVTTTVNGSNLNTSVEIKKPTFSVTKVDDGKIPDQGSTEFKFDQVNVIIVSFTGQEGYLVWTEDMLSVSERDALISAIANMGTGQFNENLKSGKKVFFSTREIITNGFDYRGHISVNNDGTLSFESNNQWNMIWAGNYTKQKGVNVEIEVLNSYEPEKVIIDLQKYGSDYTKQHEGAEFNLFEGTFEKGKLAWSNEPIGGYDNISVTETNNQELTLKPGYYMLRETKSPIGFAILDEAIYFNVDNGIVKLINQNGEEIENSDELMWELDSNSNSIVLKIKNNPLYELPSAGGPGIFLYMIGGTLLLMAGSLMIYINRRKGVLRK